ncbi:ester cyclase [Stenotrophomonas indicatrix]|uniref:ester cyclase n=1 Tax=Stenotrophomonas indicatrix TaxID=2045451 RepID=UPI0013DF0E17|nr:ester cyclase [Stenotrophomonas indicatrix]
MSRLALALAVLTGGTPANALDLDNSHRAAIWYEAFSKHDPDLLGTVLADDWYETPSAERGGKQTAMKLLVSLTTVFPDFDIEIKDMIQEGNKVVVRSHITGTHMFPFLGFPARKAKLSIQAIDIHEFKEGKIVHTWHSEDWMTGLRQLGVLSSEPPRD